MDLYVELSAYRYQYIPIKGRLDAANIEPGDVIDLEYLYDGHLMDDSFIPILSLVRKWQVLSVNKRLVSDIGRTDLKAVERLHIVT